jgi:hypothetical protein
MCAWIKKLVFDRIAFMALFAFCLLVHLLSIVQSCLFSSGRTQESASTEETPGNASGSQLRRRATDARSVSAECTYARGNRA